MTLKEAKDILKKEFAVIGLHKSTEPFEFDESGWIEHEKPSVLEAFRVLAKEGYYVAISGHDYNMREKRLQKEYEKNTKAPGSAENRIKEDSGVNPALKEAASQFNDALLDEQAKKIEELTEENERKTKGYCELVAENVDLKEVLRKTESLLNDTREANSKNLDTCFKNEDIIDDLKKNLSERTKLAKKYAKELSDSSLELCKLEKQLKDKNAILSDVAEELRLSKIREKNLTEVCQKYMKENEELKKKLADKVVDKIDAQVLKSAESALAWKDRVIYYKEKVIAEKNEVIADLTHELKAKHKKYVWYKGAYDAAQQILNTIADYAAKHPDKKFSDQMIGVDIAEKGGDHSAIIVQCCKNIAISKDEAEIIERCTKNGTELHYSENDGFTYTNIFGDEIPIICLRGMYQVFTDEEIKNMKK